MMNILVMLSEAKSKVTSEVQTRPKKRVVSWARPLKLRVITLFSYSPRPDLAGYIGVTKAPQNAASAPIAMTAPVVKAPDDTMSFILPAEFDSLEKVPEPTSPDVTVAGVPPAYGAVATFTGRCTPSQSAQERKALLARLTILGFTRRPVKWELWQYNPPFTIPFLRRNEVWVEMTKEEVRTAGCESRGCQRRAYPKPVGVFAASRARRATLILRFLDAPY